MDAVEALLNESERIDVLHLSRVQAHLQVIVSDAKYRDALLQLRGSQSAHVEALMQSVRKLLVFFMITYRLHPSGFVHTQLKIVSSKKSSPFFLILQ
jgi:hypothetical protein